MISKRAGKRFVSHFSSVKVKVLLGRYTEWTTNVAQTNLETGGSTSSNFDSLTPEEGGDETRKAQQREL